MTMLTIEQRNALRAFARERADELGELAIDRVLAEQSRAPNRKALRRATALNMQARRGVAADLYKSMLALFERGTWRFHDFEGFKAAVRSGEFHDWESIK